MRFGGVVLLLAAFIGGPGSTVPAQDSAGTSLDSILAEIDTALSYIKITPADLSLRTDYVDLDSFRLDIVNQVMTNPTDMAVLLDSAGNHISNCIEIIDRAFNRNRRDVTDGFYRGFAQKGECANAVLDKIGDINSRAEEWLIAFPLGCWIFYHQLGCCASGQSLLNPLIAGWERAEVEFLTDTLPQLLIEDPDAEFYPPEKIDSLQKVSEKIAERFSNLSDKLKWRNHIGRLVWAGREQQLFADFRLPLEHDNDSVGHAPAIPAFEGRIEFEIEAGRVAFGGTGNDFYSGKYFFIFDPAGDDIYDLTPMEPGENQAIYDLSGDDIYLASEGYGLGCGFFGFGILQDRGGDDIYRAGNFSLGSGFFGVGILIDLEGNDVYISDTFTQGAGAFGYGYLYDHSGNDQYTSALYSQAFGFAAGVGLLADRVGNDTYFAGGKYKDVLRYEDHYLSLSQGFSYGIRPDFSGGVGWLLDGDGNDVYNCDIFGQGCSYWWAFGGLSDGGGNDTYNCFQYGQGSATHMAAGILYDKGGSDVYYGKGLMQGCGHDRATGWLLDLGGNDSYICWDLSQGAGSANGTGMLTDGGGEDRYYVKNPANTQAYGNPRRDFGSIGVFLDLGGTDRYDGNGRDNDVWIINSKWGIGVDKNSQPETEEK